MIRCSLKINENYQILVDQFHENFPSETVSCNKIESVFRDVKGCFNASSVFKGLTYIVQPDWELCPISLFGPF